MANGREKDINANRRTLAIERIKWTQVKRKLHPATATTGTPSFLLLPIGKRCMHIICTHTHGNTHVHSYLEELFVYPKYI